MPSEIVRNLLTSSNSTSVPANLNLVRQASFDRLAALACRVTGRSRAAIYLNLQSVEFVIGVHGDIEKDQWKRELPDYIHDADFSDISDARLVLNDLDSVNGTYSVTRGLTVVAVKCGGVRLGNLVVADSDRVGPLTPHGVRSLRRISVMAGELIDYYSQIALLARDVGQIVAETSVASLLPPNGA